MPTVDWRQTILTDERYRGGMLGEVIEKAAELAECGEPTVDRALTRYEHTTGPIGSRAKQVWVSVAFLINRHLRLEKQLPK